MSKAPSWFNKPKSPGAVKSVLLIVLIVFLGLLRGLVAAEPAAPAETLPDIEARTFDLRIVRKSKSGRVILFESGREALPKIGRILLLKRGDQPAVVVRVLKIYPDQGAFAAKGLRNYPAAPLMDPG